MTIRQHLQTTIHKALEDLQIVGNLEPHAIHLEKPADSSHGDFASNIAMNLCSSDEKVRERFSSPRELADEIAEELGKSAKEQNIVSDVNVAGPGFINFKLSQDHLVAELPNYLDDSLAKNLAKNPNPQKIYVEHTQPNTNKPNHIGHLRNSLLGMSLVRLLRATGEDVVSTNINNDRGIANVKNMWAYLAMGDSVTAEDLKKPAAVKALESYDWQARLSEWSKNKSAWKTPESFEIKPDVWVGAFYVIGSTSYDESEQVQKDMQSMVQAWENEEPLVRELWRQMNNWFYEGSWQTLNRLGVELDQQEYESEMYKLGKELVVEALESGNEHFEQLEDGAIRAILEPYKLPNKILVRRDGTAIYMTFDFELTRRRTQDYGMDKGIWVVGSDQELHFQQLFQLSEFLGFGKKEQWQHFSYGMVELTSGKMSSRKGTVVTVDTVLDMAVERAKEVMDEAGVGADVSEAQLAEMAESIGLGAVAYFILNYKPQSKIKFDLEKAVNFEGNSGPYLQYTYVRCLSALRKSFPDLPEGNISSIAKQIDTLLNQKGYLEHSLNKEESDLLRNLYSYSEVVQLAAVELAPHHLCAYLYELAQSFNSFYGKHQIRGEDAAAQFRQILALAVARILEHGLSLLGIKTVERM